MSKCLKGHYKRCTVKEVHPHIKFIKSDKEGMWYFMMGAMVDAHNVGEFSGDHDEFLRGQFLGTVTATKLYPFAPPEVEMLTPTSIFPLNTNDFCIDIGKYHKENYPATLGMDGYVQMIWSGLVGWRSLGNGINLTTGKTKPAEQVTLISIASEESQEYNKKHNPTIVEMFRCYTQEKKTDGEAEQKIN